MRVDNTKTAVSRGAGAWGELNPSYRRYAKAVRFHIDACPVRHPQAKGKVERGIGADRAWREVGARDWSGWDELQAWTDERVDARGARTDLPGDGHERVGGVAGGATLPRAGAAAARAVRPGGDAHRGAGLHGRLRGAALLGAVRAAWARR